MWNVCAPFYRVTVRTGKNGQDSYLGAPANSITLISLLWLSFCLCTFFERVNKMAKSTIEKRAGISVLCEQWKISHKPDWKPFLAGSFKTPSEYVSIEQCAVKAQTICVQQSGTGGIWTQMTDRSPELKISRNTQTAGFATSRSPSYSFNTN